MGENLKSQYDEVIHFIEEYNKWMLQLINRAMFSWRRGYLKWLLYSFKLLKKGFVSDSDKQSPEFIELLKSAASDEERKKRFFVICTSEYAIDSLSKEIEKNFPKINFVKIKRLHDLKLKEVVKFNLKSTIGVVFGFGTLLLRTVPSVVVNKFWNYETFQMWTFWLMVIFIAYLILILMPFWINYIKAKKRHEWIGNILSYTEIRIKG
jgi:hypothetical protein